MKNAKTVAFLLLISLLLAPLTGPLLQTRADQEQTSSLEPPLEADAGADIARLLAMLAQSNVTGSSVSSDNASDISVHEEQYRVLLSDSGDIVLLSPKDYLRGCVAAEMPLEYEDEALKAQIIAAHTYAVSYKLRQLASPSPGLQGADISDDPSSGQSYISDEEIARRYPDRPALISHLNDLIDQVGDYIMIYEGEPVVAAYHAISAGKTESAQNIWGAYSPYLVAVNSENDKSAPNFQSTVKLTATEVRALLKSAGITPSGQAKNWFSNILKTPSGYVSAINFGDASLTGAELRSLFGLRSTCFSVSYAGGTFTFTVKGWGHGVGMSQYGAQSLALKGKTYIDILKTYYKGISFCEL